MDIIDILASSTNRLSPSVTLISPSMISVLSLIPFGITAVLQRGINSLEDSSNSLIGIHFDCLQFTPTGALYSQTLTRAYNSFFFIFNLILCSSFNYSQAYELRSRKTVWQLNLKNSTISVANVSFNNRFLTFLCKSILAS